tara:strand:+ start:626 stop:1624 length:999 start_codon:yes stop_codon:yes gene_type:complete
MSLYGYSDALSQGTSFNAKTTNFNDGVLAHNQNLQTKYKQKVKNQGIQLGDDTRQKDEDEAFYGFKDGTGTLSTGLGTGSAIASIAKKGFVGYAGDETSARINNIKTTVGNLVKGKPPPPPADMELSDIGSDGKEVAGTSGQVVGDVGDAGKNAELAGGLIGDAGAGATDVAKQESSGLMAGAMKKGLQLATAGKVGDAGLTALSEVGGKVAGDFSGAIDVGKSIDSLVHGKNVFSGESTADKFQEVGAIADVAGTVFPPLEVVGGILNLTGGFMDAFHDLKGDLDRKKSDSTAPPPPKLTSVKISPAFSSMGLVSSSLPSVKTQIGGSGSF